MMKKTIIPLLICLLTFSLSGCSNFLGQIDGGIKKDPKITFTSRLIEILDLEPGGDGIGEKLTGWRDTYEIPEWKLRFTASVGCTLHNSFYNRHEDSDFFFSGNRLFRVSEEPSSSGGFIRDFDTSGPYIEYFPDMGDKTIDDFKKEGEIVHDLGSTINCRNGYEIVNCEDLIRTVIDTGMQSIVYFFKPGERSYYALFDGEIKPGCSFPDEFDKIEFFHE